jgi:hypothetical protein
LHRTQFDQLVAVERLRLPVQPIDAPGLAGDLDPLAREGFSEERNKETRGVMQGD